MTDRRPDNRDGFTLLEVLAALLILGLSIGVYMDLQGRTMRAAGTMKKKAQALTLAETALDEFLAAPTLTPTDSTFDSSEDSVWESGATKLTVRRIITEHVPLNEQYSIYTNLGDDPTLPLDTSSASAGSNGTVISDPLDGSTASSRAIANTLDAAASTSPDQATASAFDPGTFVSVRIEVYDNSDSTAPLVALESWLPKPPVNNGQPALTPSGASGLGAGGATPSGTPGAGGSGRPGTGTGTGLGRPPASSGPVPPSGGSRPPATGQLRPPG